MSPSKGSTKSSAGKSAEGDAPKAKSAKSAKSAKAAPSSDPTIAALERELAGYENRGLDDRAAAVKEAIAAARKS